MDAQHCKSPQKSPLLLVAAVIVGITVKQTLDKTTLRTDILCYIYANSQRVTN